MTEFNRRIVPEKVAKAAEEIVASLITGSEADVSNEALEEKLAGYNLDPHELQIFAQYCLALVGVKRIVVAVS